MPIFDATAAPVRLERCDVLRLCRGFARNLGRNCLECSAVEVGWEWLCRAAILALRRGPWVGVREALPDRAERVGFACLDCRPGVSSRVI